MLETYDKSHDRRALKFGVLVLLGFVCAVAVIQLMCRTPEDSAKAIERSPLLQEHDRFCLSIARPPDFMLKFKMVGGNNVTREISYHYESRLTFAQVDDFYSDELSKEGWRKTDEYMEEMSPIPKFVSFKKDNYNVTIEHDLAVGEDTPAEYTVNCAYQHR